MAKRAFPSGGYRILTDYDIENENLLYGSTPWKAPAKRRRTRRQIQIDDETKELLIEHNELVAALNQAAYAKRRLPEVKRKIESLAKERGL
tara:strand:+ start:7688 stop:7960 length:273 start_codon:yes stop_codon:yes gene_type:complete